MLDDLQRYVTNSYTVKVLDEDCIWNVLRNRLSQPNPVAPSYQERHFDDWLVHNHVHNMPPDVKATNPAQASCPNGCLGAEQQATSFTVVVIGVGLKVYCECIYTPLLNTPPTWSWHRICPLIHPFGHVVKASS